ncbi:AbrB/MazE/SpoVT family DNA-binding domain-containing protein [Noviherbaspirillum denitrificans]|uniref:AbrB/MazE/SpoVT family DNA-binding domain-containing protein n=1 Tax=Noviherbaspirillum denitrificans TaxID=1968433 RepID=UPI0019818C02|nr:AbrB/MazE/SpoVT family DNA-binding domain-containing protein [Noviherbaspirillum denitrificans]
MSWQTTIQAPCDGSGGQILLLPKELLNEMGWAAGDNLSVTIRSEAGEIVLRRMGEINQRQFDEMRARGRR